MRKHIKDLKWKELLHFFMFTPNLDSRQHHATNMIYHFTVERASQEFNKVLINSGEKQAFAYTKTKEYKDLYKEAFAYFNKDILELEIETTTNRIVEEKEK